eukprot:gnl/TRDRNA2_/TRDRNA2_156995_c1_seq1.p1 gnl/TRDRNA2_/TRDRNA2_156995_c1~~gnl/TRDRNA2_/TRDRNA2_156995_c1_seq1.p1  ORF type:complete len:761 (-),score=171.95 gnl/TRDRNA2_/TRDRNA2_156995_c1_seq1:21-1991(-)
MAAAVAKGGGNTNADAAARLAACAMRKRVAELQASSAKAFADAQADVIPTHWAADESASASSVKAKECVGRVVTRASTLSMLQRCQSKAEALAVHLCNVHLGDKPSTTGPLSSWLYELCAACGRMALLAASVLRLVRQASSALTADGSSSEASMGMDVALCARGESKLDEMLSVCRQGTLLSQTPLDSLNELEAQLRAVAKALAPGAAEPLVPPSCRGTVLVLLRLGATYRYGANTAASQQDSRASEWLQLGSRLREAASSLQDASQAFSVDLNLLEACDREKDLEPEEQTIAAKLSERLRIVEDAIRSPGFLQTLAQQAEEVAIAMDTLLSSTSAAQTPLKLREACGHGASKAWASWCVDVRDEIDRVFEMQKLVNLECKNLQEKRRCLGNIEQQLAEVDAKRQKLELELADLEKHSQKALALKDQAEKLRAGAGQDTSAQAKLELDLSCARARREEQERASRDADSELAKLEGTMEARQRRPHEELQGRATVQELAALRCAIVKDSRDLYANNVAKIADLPPLPTAHGASAHGPQALEACVTRYADVRRALLLEWAGTRLSKLPDGSTTRPPGAERQMRRIEQLQLRLAEVRSTVAGFAPADGAPKGSAPLAPAAAPVTMKLEVPCPRWARLAPPEGPLAVTFDELRGIHSLLV